MTGRVGLALVVVKVDFGGFGQCGWRVRCHGAVLLLRNVVNLEQITDAPSKDEVPSLIESAREEALMERRRQNLVVNREPSFYTCWTGERLDVPTRGLLSRVMGVASRSRTAFPPPEVSLERNPWFLSQHHHPPTSSMLMVLRGSLTNSLVTRFGEQFLSLRTMSSWVKRVSVLVVTGHELAFHSLLTMRLSPGVNGAFTHMNCFLAVNEILMFQVTGQSLLKTVHNPLLEIPI